MLKCFMVRPGSSSRLKGACGLIKYRGASITISCAAGPSYPVTEQSEGGPVKRMRGPLPHVAHRLPRRARFPGARLQVAVKRLHELGRAAIVGVPQAEQHRAGAGV